MASARVGCQVYVKYAPPVAALVVPFGKVTETTTVCGCADGGLTVRSSVSETTVNVPAGEEPKRTPSAPVNPAPVTVTTVPPVVGPPAGSTRET
jgi:hypothetical protein